MSTKLNKLNNFKGVAGPVLTIVMDGVGLAGDTVSNAVKTAYTPNLDRLMENYPMVALKAHGTAVGLPSDDDMGNSEVGHNALGAGQVFAQGAKLVSNSIESGKMFVEMILAPESFVYLTISVSKYFSVSVMKINWKQMLPWEQVVEHK